MVMKNFRLILNVIVVLAFIGVSHAQARSSGTTVRSGSGNELRSDSNVRSAPAKTPAQNQQNSAVKSNVKSNIKSNNNAKQNNRNTRSSRKQSTKVIENNRVNSTHPSLENNKTNKRGTQNSVRSSNSSNNIAISEVKVEKLPKAQKFNKSAVRIENGNKFTSNRIVYHPNSNAKFNVVRHKNNQYFLDNGYYYQKRNQRYYRVLAPVGMMFSSLPHGHLKIFIGAQQYYHYHGTYYRWKNNHYYVVNPPIGAIVHALPKDYLKIHINGGVYYEYFGVVYQKIKYRGHRAYQIVGYLD